MRACYNSWKMLNKPSTTRSRDSWTANKRKYLSNDSARRTNPHAPLCHENEVNHPRRANETHHWAALDAEPQEVQDCWRVTPKDCEISSTPSTTP